MTLNRENRSGLVAYGRKRAIVDAREEIERAVREKYADDRASARGLPARWSVRRRAAREINEIVERVAPRGGLYAQCPNAV